MKSGYSGFFNPSVPVNIALGAQESDAINCGGFILSGIILPSLFTGTALTFEVGDSLVGFQANGEILFTAVPTDGDTLTINGTTITFVDASPGAFEVLNGLTAAATAANLQAFLEASTDTGLVACTYSTVGALTIVTAVVHGTAGNAYTFAKSSTHITLAPSGGTLTGGGFRPLYDASNALVSMTVAQGRCYAVDPKNFQGVEFLKIKSGSAEASARTLICALRGF